jgi:hypothetical protein
MKIYLKPFIFAFLLMMAALVLSQNNGFMQQLQYNIDVELDDIDNTLKGNIRIIYQNNSPDSLDFIYFHLWPNAFRNTSTAWAKQSLFLRDTEFYFSDGSQRGMIDSLNFKVDGISADLIIDSFNIDIAKLILPQKLLPGSKIEITSPFYVKLPPVWSRLGYAMGNYYITHWYPKPAVYDEEGWHPMPYLSMGEFYQEFADWQVNITLPVNYIVAANANLVSREELHRLEDYAMACNKGESSDAFVYKDSSAKKTLQYKADNMIDFAWFASKNFIVRMENLYLPESESYVKCMLYYSPQNKYLWEDALQYAKNSLILFSEIIGEYPYPYCIIVEEPFSGGGMEYPGIVTASSYSKEGLEKIIAHEIAHIWFFGALASNERNIPWIDEGFASYYEQRYIDKHMKDTHPARDYFGNNLKIRSLLRLPNDYLREFTWLIMRRENLSQAPGLPSDDFHPVNYFVMLYNKTAVAIKSLEKYLGTEVFDEMIKAFYLENRYAHVKPVEIERFFTSYTQKDLSWFFDDLIYSDKKLDYKIVGQKKDSICIKNVGEIDFPLFLFVVDSLIIADGFADKMAFPNRNNEAVFIDRDFYGLDYNRNNNYYYPSFKNRLERYKLRFGHVIDNPNFRETAWFVFPGYNLYDGIMPGFVLYNSVIPKKSFEYQIAPMYGIRSRNLSGFFRLSAFVHPNSDFVREFEFYTLGKKYSVGFDNYDYFAKLEQGLRIKFKSDFTSYHKSEFVFRNIYASDFIHQNMRFFQQAGFSFSNYRVLNPFSAAVKFERSYGYVKSWLELNYQITYNSRGKALDLRLFSGAFLYNSSTYYGNYNFRLTGDIGSQDYLYDYIFTGRFEDIRNHAGNIFAHQFVQNQGGFAIYSPYGQTNKWLGAVNITTCLPVPWLRAYLNLGMVADNNEFFSIGEKFYEAGFELRLPGEFCSIFFPVLLSEQIREASNSIYTENYLQKIRFTLYLGKINPVIFRDKFYLLY